jgi:hypothetical protein
VVAVSLVNISRGGFKPLLFWFEVESSATGPGNVSEANALASFTLKFSSSKPGSNP